MCVPLTSTFTFLMQVFTGVFGNIHHGKGKQLFALELTPTHSQKCSLMCRQIVPVK